MHERAKLNTATAPRAIQARTAPAPSVRAIGVLAPPRSSPSPLATAVLLAPAAVPVPPHGFLLVPGQRGRASGWVPAAGGDNRLEVAVTNTGVPGATAQRNPGGLLYCVTVTYTEEACEESVWYADVDGDGIGDDVDKCVYEPENRNDYLDEDGCPDTPPQNVRITQEKIEIDDKILFASGKSRILPVSYGILDSVAQVMRDYPAIRVKIEGHTDSDGSDSSNLRLSQARAEAVREYLISRGSVASVRLGAEGFGETMPIDTNRTAAGKAIVVVRARR